jgi:hypothetical protein
VLLGRDVAALDPLGQFDLLRGAEQIDAADRAQVEAQRVEARLDGEVELGLGDTQVDRLLTQQNLTLVSYRPSLLRQQNLTLVSDRPSIDPGTAGRASLPLAR